MIVFTAAETCLMFSPSWNAISRAWNCCRPTAGSTTTWIRASGSLAAISSMSIPPRVEAMTRTRSAFRSST